MVIIQGQPTPEETTPEKNEPTPERKPEPKTEEAPKPGPVYVEDPDHGEESGFYEDPEPANGPEYFPEENDDNGPAPSFDNFGDFITPELLVNLADKLISVTAPLAVNAISKKKIKAQDIALSASEKRILQEPLHKAVGTIPVNIDNPWTALAITAISIYTAKIVTALTQNTGQPEAATRGRGRPKKY